MAQFARAHKDLWSKAESAAHNQECAFVGVDCPKYPSNFLGVSHSSKVSAFHRRERALEVAGWITFSPLGGNRITEDLAIKKPAGMRA